MSCSHLRDLVLLPITAEDHVCAECVKTGSRWVHLRKCQSCGQTHCCDSSPNKHATRHFHETGHSVAISAEPGERWAWCFADREFEEY
ncbi:MAG: hypothetical protein EAZ89_17135 [Bacteroidetes bacterium]|nr:MAG: hypothetical protein EAZ89_17135 [Bacteroidota bacterium]